MPDAQERMMSLSIPADSCWGLVVRMALGGAGALMGLSIDLIDDLRTAADEACDFLLHQPRKARRLEMVCSLRDDKVCTVFSCVWDSACQNCVETDLDITRGILETLIPQVDLEEEGACIRSVSLTLPLHCL